MVKKSIFLVFFKISNFKLIKIQNRKFHNKFLNKFKSIQKIPLLFFRNRDMVMHKRKIHLNERTPITSFKCVECRKVFPTGESLQIHMTKDHVVEQVIIPPEIIAPNIDPIHNLPGPHHLHPHHHQAILQPPLLPPGMGYHQRLHPY